MQRTIALLQEQLTRLGYLAGPHNARELDGPTRAAMQTFQRIHRLRPTEKPNVATWNALTRADERGECAVTGQVTAGELPVANVGVLVQDRDLGDPGRWPSLGHAVTDSDGRFAVIYQQEQVAKGDRLGDSRVPVADLVLSIREVPFDFEGFDLYRLPENGRIPEEEHALGIQARRVEEVRIVLRGVPRDWREGESEYERVLAAFKAVWPRLRPDQVNDERREPEFVARELNFPREQVGALIAAFRTTRHPFDGSVPEPILYALERSEPGLLNMPRLAMATASRIKSAIVQGIEALIIPPQSDDVIVRSIELITRIAPEYALGTDSQPGYGAILGQALPDRAQQLALLAAAKARQDGAPSMWDTLRQHPAFSAPGTVERAQFALQLDALTSRHLPLMSALQGELRVTSTRALLDLGSDRLKAIVTRPDVGVPPDVPGDTPEQRADNFVSAVIGQLQHAFPTETVAKAIARAPADAVGGQAIQAGVTDVLSRATTDALRAAGAAFDIKTTRIDAFLKDHPDVMRGVAENLRPAVTTSLKRAQRLYAISTGLESFEWLLGKGVKSGFEIAEIPQETFVRSAEDLGSTQARMMHNRALNATAVALSTYVHLRDLVTGIFPAGVNNGKDWIEASGEIKGEIDKTLPTWGELFKENSFCECTHCRSVYSPCAYLVDLLNVLDHSVRDADNKSPLDILFERRPDLELLKLTCENTNTVMPYVDLVNEVLESLVISLKPALIPAFDTAGAASEDLRAAPQHTNWQAYVTPPGAQPRPDRAVYPNNLPFDAPLVTARAYLQTQKVKRVDLMAAFASGPLTHAHAAERLRLSPGMFTAITGNTIDGNPSDLAAGIDDRFGWNAHSPADLSAGDEGRAVWSLKLKLNSSGAALALAADPEVEAFGPDTTAAVQAFQVTKGLPGTGAVDKATWAALLTLNPPISLALLPQATTLLERTGMTYAELVALLKLRIVNPEQRTFETLSALRLPGADVLAFAAAGLTNPTADLIAALQKVNVSEADFTEWAQTHLTGDAIARLRLTIFADGPKDDPCNLDAVRLRHWDPAAPAITETEWLKLDRLVRLWRGIGWELNDLDLALSALGATDTTPEIVRRLAQIAEVAERVDLTTAQVVALWKDLDPTHERSLYTRHFRSRTVLRLDPAFEPDWSGQPLAGAKVEDHLEALQAGLRCTGSDLSALRAHLGMGDQHVLDVAGVSRLFRHVLLARALELNARDLVAMLGHTGLDPFRPPADGWSLSAFVREVRRLQEANTNVAQLSFVLADLTVLPTDDARDKLLNTLKAGLQGIAAEFAPALETADGSLTRRALILLEIDPPLIDDAMPCVLGTTRVTTVLAQRAAPAPNILTEWADRLRYTAPMPPAVVPPPEVAPPTLSLVGTLTDAEEVLLRGFSADAQYGAAVHRLWAAPRTTLQKLAAALKLKGIDLADPANLLSQSIFVGAEPREAVVRARLLTLLQAVLPPLQDRLKRALVKQTLAALRLEAGTLELLLEKEKTSGKPVIPANDPAKTLITDFLAIETNASLDDARRGYELLSRVGMLVDVLRLKRADIDVIARSLVSFRSKPMRLLSMADWSIVATYGVLRNRPGLRGDRFAMLWDQTSVEGARAMLKEVLGWPDETIAGLMAPDGLGMGLADLKDVAKLERFVTAGALVQTLGASAAVAAGWARSPIDQDAADAILRAIKGKYDQKGWPEVAKAANDTLREARRAALVAYLVPRLGARNPDHLYEQLLIDVQTSPSVMTSRIKQAISSVQLFCQRSRMGLEAHVIPGALDDKHLEVISRYRVWEANRKVLLYPENWILPSLRDDKTPAFREFESNVLQNDPTKENVEDALLKCLDQVDAVSKLEIIALHVQEEFAPEEKLQTVVHIFGRTPNPPNAYYYRRYVVTENSASYWTPWEKVPVDVQGSLVVAVTFHRRLYLFWAIVETKKEEPLERTQEIRLAWSEYHNGKWSPKRTTDRSQRLRVDMTYEREVGDVTVQGVARLRPLEVIERIEADVGAALRVTCILRRDIVPISEMKEVGSQLQYVTSENGKTHIAGWFVLDTCHGSLVAVANDKKEEVSGGIVLRVVGGALKAKSPGAWPSPEDTVLGVVLPTTQLTEERWVHSGPGYAVFADAGRTYFAHLTTVERPGHDLLEHPQLAAPKEIGALPAIPAFESAGIGVMKDIRAKAQAASNSWSSASASLATISLIWPEPSGDHAMIRIPKDTVLVQAENVQRITKYLIPAARTATIKFEPLFHPFVCSYIEKVAQFGIPGLLTLENQDLVLAPPFEARYKPNPSSVVKPYPVDLVDFGATAKPGIFQTTAYSVYNWELFFHIPMMIADLLSQNQRFADSQRWLHFVFNPTDGKQDYWKVLPLRKTPVESVITWLEQLNAGDPDLQAQIAEWKDHPFEPHRIARMRLTSYKKYVVMQYLENLIKWGDHLFARETLESINSATLLYVMAANLLGNKLTAMAPRTEPPPMTFKEMRGKLDALSNVVAEFENAFPHLNSASAAPSGSTAGLLGVSKTFYFCIPPNDKLLGYWDTVANRLFKIRNSMSLAGVFRELPLFEPPIDPALLVRAVAQGVDIDSALQDLNTPLSFYRFPQVLQQALDACADARSLGAALLSALEKKDAEVLAALRATQETSLLRASLEAVKQRELEAAEQMAALERSRATQVARLLHFRGLMGVTDLATPEIGAAIPMMAYNPKPTAEGGVFLIDEEMRELAASHSARDWQVRSSTTDTLASLSHYIPTLVTGVVGVQVEFGGPHVGPALAAIARYQASLGAQDGYDAAHAGKMAGYKRRQQDYAFQSNLAGREIMQIDKLITAAQIRGNIARLEREQQEMRIAQAEIIEEYLRSKYTSTELYGWMQGQLSGLYFQTYKLAHHRAKQAERSFRFALGISSGAQYIQFDGWDSLHKGLLAGERLHLQLRQLEQAFHDQNRRDLELTRHFSLQQIAPMALIQLKETGTCEFELPEWLFDMDYPGHYMRRVKSVSLSIPAVVGPYTPVNATLTMLTNETRVDSTLRGGKYEKDLEVDDPRFVNDFTAIQAIATSSGREDSGMFELNFRDERYIPFEGAGAAARFRIKLDPDCNRFPLAVVADVILHYKYTARAGGAQFAEKAKEHWKKLAAERENLPFARAFSLKHEFPTEWHRLRTVVDQNGHRAQTFTINRDRFPVLFQRSRLTISAVDVIGVPTAEGNVTKLPVLRLPGAGGAPVVLKKAAEIGDTLHHAGPVNDLRVEDRAEDAAWTVAISQADAAASIDQLEDVLVVYHYSARQG